MSWHGIVIAQIVLRSGPHNMEFTLEPREGFLVATVTGQLSLTEALRCLKTVCDVAAERGIGRILLDCLAVDGELSVVERYELGKTIADYCRRAMAPKIAAIGKPPTI